MAEEKTAEIISYTTEEVDLRSQIKRIAADSQKPNQPRVGLPDFSDRQTYELVVGLARQLRESDPLYQNFFRLIPSYEEFMQDSAGRHFRGDIPRSEVNEKGEHILNALAKAVLDIPGARPSGNRRLLVARDEATGTPVGFATITEYGTIRDALQRTDNSYPLKRLLDILVDPNDQYWYSLIKQGVISQIQTDQLDEVKKRLSDLPLITPNDIYTNPQFRRKGVATTLIRRIGLGFAVIANTNQATTLLLHRNALPEYHTILAPAVDLESNFPEEEKLIFLALQIIPISAYEQQYRDLVAAKSPQAAKHELFSDIRNVAKGVFRFGLTDLPFDLQVQKEAIDDGSKAGVITSREIGLLSVPDIRQTQYPLISVSIRDIDN